LSKTRILALVRAQVGSSPWNVALRNRMRFSFLLGFIGTGRSKRKANGSGILPRVLPRVAGGCAPLAEERRRVPRNSCWLRSGHGEREAAILFPARKPAGMPCPWIQRLSTTSRPIDTPLMIRCESAKFCGAAFLTLGRRSRPAERRRDPARHATQGGVSPPATRFDRSNVPLCPAVSDGMPVPARDQVFCRRGDGIFGGSLYVPERLPRWRRPLAE